MVREAFQAGAGPDIELIDWKQVELFDHEVFEVRFKHKGGRIQAARGPSGSRATLEMARDAGELARSWGDRYT
jgi:hypothetical protein